MNRRILAGDIGGTKTRLAVYQCAGEERALLLDRTYPSANYATFDSMLAEFLAEAGENIAAACFGVAGPVREGRCVTTNLPWVLDENQLAESTDIPNVHLLNDLEATAYGLLRLAPEELVELNPDARPTAGNIAVLAAGTGLGEALLHWDGQAHRVVATEGGHTDFAPNSDVQDGLLRHLRGSFGGHVSYERVVSGPGLFNVYRYLRDSGHAPESPELAMALSGGGDAGPLVGEYAGRGDPLARAALALFVQVYGAEAGNWALKTLAHGGVLLGGGIAAKILPALRENGAFLDAFCDKGRYAAWLRTLSVKVSLNPDAGLLGAAGQAVDLLA